MDCARRDRSAAIPADWIFVWCGLTRICSPAHGQRTKAPAQLLTISSSDSHRKAARPQRMTTANNARTRGSAAIIPPATGSVICGALLNPEPVTVRKISLITGGPNPHQMRACLAYLARLAPSAQRDRRTHPIARHEADATAKEEQERLLHISSLPLGLPTSLLVKGASQCAPQ